MSQTISIDNATLASLDAAASLRNMTREDTLREAVDRLAEYDAWFRAKVEAGLHDVREGKVVPHEEMEAETQALCERLSMTYGVRS